MKEPRRKPLTIFAFAQVTLLFSLFLASAADARNDASIECGAATVATVKQATIAHRYVSV